MKHIIIAALAVASLNVNAQFTDFELWSHAWRVGKTKVIYKHTIMRHMGKNEPDRVTNICYQTKEQLAETARLQAVDQMWTNEKLAQHIDYYNLEAPGGRVTLFVERPTISSADLDAFSIIVRDSTDVNEIIHIDLPSETPNYTASTWYNTAFINLKEEVSLPIIIYLVDRFGGYNNKYKFTVMN